MPELEWEPKINIVYRPRYSGPRRPVSTSNTTETNVFYFDGKQACHCSFSIGDNDRVEIRTKSDFGELVRQKPGNTVPVYHITGECYMVMKDGKILRPSETNQTLGIDRKSLKFSKHVARSVCNCRPGGWNVRIFTYLVETSF
jgi:hypothetical protein